LIITRTPFRISFFGGGTDYPKWYQEHGGSVLSSTIDKYCYITCRYLPPFFEHKHRIVYSKVEMVSDINEIEHPAVKAVLNTVPFKNGLEIHHDGDLPARSGIGSSSAFTVGLIRSLYALKGELISKRELAELAIHVEQNVIKEAVGSQDQIATSYGGLNRIDFSENGEFTVNPVIISKSRVSKFKKRLLLFFTGVSRNAPEIAKIKIDNISKKTTELNKINSMVDEAQKILVSNGDLLDFGKLLNEHWLLKKSLAPNVSTNSIDEMYEAAINAGATGGKILGAGGGGFLLLYCEPDFQKNLRKAMNGLLEIPFSFEFSGSQVVHFHPPEEK
jgi:D-glycero-alpha-D-manno-heptose-7-phosphate kinase